MPGIVDPQARPLNRRRDNISIDGPRVKKVTYAYVLTHTHPHTNRPLSDKMFILSFFFHHRLLSLSWPCCHYDVLSEPELVSQNMMLSRYFFLLFWGNRTWWYRIISSWYASVKPPLISYDIRVVSPLLPLPSHAFELHWLFNLIYDSLQLSWIMLWWNFYLCSPEAKKTIPKLN